MDAETQRLLITALIAASSAIIGGFGGAVFTARTTRANTRDTLDQAELLEARKQATTREAEHEVWQRDERMKVYADFLAAINDEVRKIKPIGNPGAMELDYPRKELARIEIVSSQKVRVLARRFFEHVGMFQSAASFVAMDGTLPGIPESDKDRNMHVYNGAARELTRLTADYIEAVREDLGTAGEDDDRTTGINEGVNIGPLPNMSS